MSRPKDDNDADVPQELRPIDEQPPPDEPPIDEPPPPPPPPPPDGSGVTISQVSPIAGVLAGGIEVTLTGTGFQPGAEVFFGGSQSPQVFHDSETTVRATLPQATQAGSVTVSLVNPDGSNARLEGGFTYIATEATNRVEVLGVSPLAVIEDTETEVTVRGRNLIAAFNEGLVALRGPTRARVNSSAPITSTDEATGIEALTFTVRITATPPLEALERLAIQVLASRADVAEEGIIESSRQMFTVLPRGLPVPLAYTENVAADKPALVMVAGRNLEGCSLDFGPGATVHMQAGDDRSIVGIVSFEGNLAKAAATPQFSILNETGSEVAQYSVSLKTDAEMAEASATVEGPAPEQPDAPVSETLLPEAGNVGLNLTPVPDQQMVAATEEDSAVFSLGGDELFGFSFNWLNFIFRLVDTTIVIPIVNEVRLIPFFDAGGARLTEVPVLAEVGKLLRLRGVGLLVALRIEIIISIRVIIIIGFRFRVPSFDFFNEFEDLFPWGIGSIVISIYIRIIVLFRLFALLAIVEPGGKLNVIARFTVRFGVIFELSNDRATLRFIDLRVGYRLPRFSVGPLKIPFPCDGRFQLASDNGQTVFLDALQASQSFYLPRAPGVCCVPWNYDFELEEFDLDSGHSEVLQQSFRYEYCLNAAPAANLATIIITSEPEPDPFPRRLVMEVADTATIIALAQPVDAVGNPIPGAPLQDVRDLGYDVEFVLEPASPDVVDPEPLREGDAFAVIPGDNVIHARLWQKNRELPPMFNFYPEGVLGFNISSLLARGLEPAVLYGSLPVTVKPQTDEIKVEPTLAYIKDAGTPNARLEEVPVYFTLQNERVMELERAEPFEPQLDLILAVKVEAGANIPRSTVLNFAVGNSEMQVAVGRTRLETRPPLQDTEFYYNDRHAKDAVGQFFALPPQGNASVTVNPRDRRVLALRDAQGNNITVAANNREAANKFVPPGENVAGGVVILTTEVRNMTNMPNVRMSKQTVTMGVRNNEIFEEYPRVFAELQAILNRVSTLASAPGSLLAELMGSGHGNLSTRGNTLWNTACTTVQATLKDDRPLYYARLQCIGAIRAYAKRKNVSGVEGLIFNFEWPSRGLETTGAISFSLATAGARKAIVTGFDPFELFGQDLLPNQQTTPARPDKSNPSGLAALALNGRTYGSTPSPAYVRSAIFPVRYKEFNAGRVEQMIDTIVTPPRTRVMDLIVMLMTMSQNGSANYYDVERWAARNRIGSFDNNKETGQQLPLAGANEFVQSTLPYDLVITSRETLPGPMGSAPFVMDQAYSTTASAHTISVNRANPSVPPPARVKAVFNPTTNRGTFRPEPLLDDEDDAAFKKKADEPEGISDQGSGGNYLSNEIFYRTAIARNARRPTLASGHFHIPSTGTTPETGGPALIASVESALTRFLNNLSHLGPVIASISPTSGRVGATVTITGERLDGALSVSIGNVQLTINSVDTDGRRITATITSTAQTGRITVETSYGRGQSAATFTVIRPRRRRIRVAVLMESLSERRLALGLTQRAAAEQMGVRPGTYSNWERGRDEPRESAHPAIIGFLGFDPSTEEQSLAERIRETREREGISQSELAERLGVAPSTVKAWEADMVSRPTPRVTGIFEEYVKEA